jgi:hypothetical protein
VPDRTLEILQLVSKLGKEPSFKFLPPSEGTRAINNYVLPSALVKDTRLYLQKIVNQINGCYERGWYDGCAVMMRRFVETLIIESFIKHSIESTIKNPVSGDFLMLKDLIIKMLAEPKFKNLTRPTKQGLGKLKEIGDLSAHSRTFTAHREDIDNVSMAFRVVSEELLYLSGIKK